MTAKCSFVKTLKSLVYFDSGRRYFLLYAKMRLMVSRQKITEERSTTVIRMLNRDIINKLMRVNLLSQYRIFIPKCSCNKNLKCPIFALAISILSLIPLTSRIFDSVNEHIRQRNYFFAKCTYALLLLIAYKNA